MIAEKLISYDPPSDRETGSVVIHVIKLSDIAQLNKAEQKRCDQSTQKTKWT